MFDRYLITKFLDIQKNQKFYILNNYRYDRILTKKLKFDIGNLNNEASEKQVKIEVKILTTKSKPASDCVRNGQTRHIIWDVNFNKIRDGFHIYFFYLSRSR